MNAGFDSSPFGQRYLHSSGHDERIPVYLAISVAISRKGYTNSKNIRPIRAIACICPDTIVSYDASLAAISIP